MNKTELFKKLLIIEGHLHLLKANCLIGNDYDNKELLAKLFNVIKLEVAAIDFQCQNQEVTQFFVAEG